MTPSRSESRPWLHAGLSIWIVGSTLAVWPGQVQGEWAFTLYREIKHAFDKVKPQPINHVGHDYSPVAVMMVICIEVRCEHTVIRYHLDESIGWKWLTSPYASLG